ncbi:MAG: GAF domain-containing sensor histidine kinase [Anaerolineae bacterium]
MTRFMMVIAFAAVVFLSRGILTPPIPDAAYADILPAAATALVLNVVLGVFIAVGGLRGAVPYLLIVADAIIVAAFTSLIPQLPLLVAGIIIVVSVQGLFRLGGQLGVVHNVVVTAAALIMLVIRQAFADRTLEELVTALGPAAVLIGLVIVAGTIWANAFDESSSARARKLEEHATEVTRRLEAMRTRAKALAEMGETLNMTLDYNKILDVCLDLGRFSLRDQPHQRLIAMVLVVEHDDRLTIANARGLQHMDVGRSFQGAAGILADSLNQATTITIGERGQYDPELGQMIAFSNIESVMVIPLRVEYATYGLLVYASTAKNAFNEDHLDTMQSLGVQATIALKNASLVETLRQEKDRLLRIEQNMRAALTRDLHDIPTQTMSALAMNLSALPAIAKNNPEKLKQEVEALRGIAMRFVDEMRYVMFTWRPLSLEEAGLGVSLEQLASKMQYTYKQKLEVQCDPEALRYLDAEQQSGLFYLIEEAANNARKHAEADVIRVRVALQGNAVIAQVADSGKGFDVEAMQSRYSKGSSFGMINMNDRAEHIGGTLDLKSAPGKGTVITVRIPVQADSASQLRKQQNRKTFERPQERSSGAPMSPLS